MKEINQKILRAAAELILKLNKAGYEAYLVGGCVRDIFMDKPPEKTESIDIDIATSALPFEVEKIFGDMKVVETGIKHGTVTVVLSNNNDDAGKKEQEKAKEGKWIAEITTFRSDGRYSDRRHPDSVRFVSSIKQDLARRDFTMNAMACDGRGDIIDIFGGKSDILKKSIRAVGDPEKRFKEDALRIIRALRFAACLGFSIEKETENAAFRYKSLLKTISAERFFSEFRKLCAGEYAGDIIRRYTDIIGEVIPEIIEMKGFSQNNPYHKYDVLEHCIRTMEKIKTSQENREYMKIAALFHDVGKPQTYSEDENGMGHFYNHASYGNIRMENLLRRLKADNFTIKRICTIVKYHSLIFEKDEALLKKWMNRFTPKLLFEILEMKKADNYATGNVSDCLLRKFDDIESMMTKILNEKQCFSLKDMAVNGYDLMGLGMEQGKMIGEVLGDLLDMITEGKIENEREILLAEAGKISDKYKMK